MSAEALAQVLQPLHDVFQPHGYPELLIGLGDPDDAAVWQIDSDRALVVTTDFFTPVVDNAYDYGAIAASNALSDIYAMGGKPFLALNIAAFPPDLPSDICGQILLGGAEVVRDSGAVLAGGHTVQDQEPKYGLVAVGFVNPERMITKSGARPGDKLVLSKPVGFGTITTALKQEKADSKDVSEVVKWMKALNKTASDLAVDHGVRAGTDISGFGLIGHSMEVAEASNVKLRFRYKSIPVVSGAMRYAEEWIFPGGSSDNRLYFGPRVEFSPGITEMEQMLIFDAQTSGGLLLCVSPKKVDALIDSAQQLNQPLWEIGEVVEGSGIEVLP